MDTIVTAKTSVTDSLQACADSLLKELRTSNGIFTPHVDSFMRWLIEADTTEERHEIIMSFGTKIIGDMHTLPLRSDSVCRQFIEYKETTAIIQQIELSLSIPFNALKIRQSKTIIANLKKYNLTTRQKKQVENLSYGLKYYKVAMRRVRDIIDDLYVLKDSAVIADDNTATTIEAYDSLFVEAVNFEERNRLIKYVPYATMLRQKVMDAFAFDTKRHIIIEQTQWETIELVKKEIETVLEKIKQN